MEKQWGMVGRKRRRRRERKILWEQVGGDLSRTMPSFQEEVEETCFLQIASAVGTSTEMTSSETDRNISGISQSLYRTVIVSGHEHSFRTYFRTRAFFQDTFPDTHSLRYISGHEHSFRTHFRTSILSDTFQDTFQDGIFFLYTSPGKQH